MNNQEQFDFEKILARFDVYTDGEHKALISYVKSCNDADELAKNLTILSKALKKLRKKSREVGGAFEKRLNGLLKEARK